MLGLDYDHVLHVRSVPDSLPPSSDLERGKNEEAGSGVAVFASILWYQNVESMECDGLLGSAAISTTPHKLFRHHHHSALQCEYVT